ncbi:MAG: GTPase [Phycisphaerales bacterium JB059]
MRFAIQTPLAPGAIGVVALCGEDLDADLASLGLSTPVGRVRHCDLLGVDRGLVARWSPTRADLTPHGGVRLMRTLAEALRARGVIEATLDPREAYPEAGSLIEARALAALSMAPSERAIDLLLDQPRRWSGVDEGVGEERLAPHAALRHLLHPPLVVIAGAPNIGKSTLVNELSGRRVSVVADESGTTRDHVGVTLELDGLTVRCLDLPGLEEGSTGPDARAQALARDVLRVSDLVLLCGSGETPPPDPEDLGIGGRLTRRVQLRSDLGESRWEADVRVSALAREGLEGLARAIRGALVPDRALADPRAWRFWEASPGGEGRS